MNSPTEPTPNPTTTVGAEGDPLGRIALDPLVYQEMRWCPDCAGERVFVPILEIDAGRVGICLGCDSRKFIPFSRECAA